MASDPFRRINLPSEMSFSGNVRPSSKPSSATLDGRSIRATGPASVREATGAEIDEAMSSLLELPLTMSVDEQGTQFVGLDLDQESLEDKYRKIDIGDTHEVHLHTVEFESATPDYQLVIFIFDVIQGEYLVDKRWSFKLSGTAACVDIEVLAIHNWAKRFSSSFKAM